jgi:hypothetical protein
VNIKQAIEAILLKTINLGIDVDTITDENGAVITMWNLPEQQPSQEDIDEMMGKCWRDLEGICACGTENVCCWYKLRKIDDFSTKCRETIFAGFTSNCFGTAKHFTYDEDDQKNMTGLAVALVVGLVTEIPYKSSDMLECSVLTPPAFMQLCTDAMQFKLATMNRFYQKRIAIEACTTKAEVDVIKWED